ncbi:uncharacterized protein [Diadema antillarum]|uniref:uncharacterized protein n=1 Tax=Diadema antillarum TaxID=105358 RepID=UPI003A8B23ED
MNKDQEGVCAGCGRRFKGKRGVAVHRARTSCGRVAVEHDCTITELGETVGGPSQVSNHRAGDPQHDLHAVFERKEPIAWPPARSDKWELFDIKLAGVLKVELAGSVEKRMRMFEGLCYGACAEEFGKKPVGSGGGGNVERDSGKSGSRRQRLMAQLRAEKKSLRRRWRQADGERASLKGLYEDLKKRYADFRRAEYQCRKRRRRRREFYKNPHRFTKRLFEEGVSGSLEVSKEELERHLKATYCDGRREEPFTGVAGLLRPQEPEVSFDLSELKLWEVEAVVKKARAGSAAGQNGLSYKLFKYCPRIRRVLWRILRVLWRERIVPVSWCVAEGVYIPKERDAKGIGQFRPISLHNVDGKILFSVLARRLSEFVMKNKFVDTSIQKAGIPGFPGGTEHVQMIWESIQRCKHHPIFHTTAKEIFYDIAKIRETPPEKYWKYLVFSHNFSGCDTVAAISWFSKSILVNKLCETDKAERAMDVFLDMRVKKDDIIKAGCESCNLMFYGIPPKPLGDLTFDTCSKRAAAESTKPEKLPPITDRSCSPAFSTSLSRLANVASSIIGYIGVLIETR